MPSSSRSGSSRSARSEGLVLADGRALTLSVREFGLLVALAQPCGAHRLAARSSTALVWGGTLRCGDRSCDVYVHKLRSKLEARCPSTASSTRMSASATASIRPTRLHIPFTRRAPAGNRMPDVRCDGRSPPWNSQRRTILKLHRFSAVLVACGALAFGVAACGDDDDDDDRRRRPATRQRPSSAGPQRHDPHRRLVDGPAARRGGGRSSSRRRRRTSTSPSAAPAPATASRSSAAARCRSPTPRAPSRPTSTRPARPRASTRSRSRSASTASRSSPTRTSRSRTTASRPSSSRSCSTPKSKVKNYSELGDGFPDQEVVVLHAGHRVGHVRLLHRGGPGDRRRAADEGRPDLGRRQPDRHRHRGHGGRAGLRRLRVRRGAEGQAEDPRGRRRRRLRRALRSTRSPTAATRRSRGRCSCTRASRRSQKPEIKGFISFILENNKEVVEAADYIPLTDELKQKAKAEPRLRDAGRGAEGRVADGGTQSRRAPLDGVSARAGRSVGEQGIKVLLAAAALLSVLTTTGIVVTLISEAVDVLRRGPVRRTSSSAPTGRRSPAASRSPSASCRSSGARCT